MDLLRYLGLGLLAGLLTWCSGNANAKSLAPGGDARLVARMAVSRAFYQPETAPVTVFAPSRRRT
jgi:hypothetical protein